MWPGIFFWFLGQGYCQSGGRALWPLNNLPEHTTSHRVCVCMYFFSGLVHFSEVVSWPSRDLDEPAHQTLEVLLRKTDAQRALTLTGHLCSSSTAQQPTQTDSDYSPPSHLWQCCTSRISWHHRKIPKGLWSWNPWWGLHYRIRGRCIVVCSAHTSESTFLCTKWSSRWAYGSLGSDLKDEHPTLWCAGVVVVPNK